MSKSPSVVTASAVLPSLKIRCAQIEADVVAQISGLGFGAVQRIDRLGVVVIEDVRVSHHQPGQRARIFLACDAGHRLPLRRRRRECGPAAVAAPSASDWRRRQTPACIRRKRGDDRLRRLAADFLLCFLGGLKFFWWKTAPRQRRNRRENANPDAHEHSHDQRNSNQDRLPTMKDHSVNFAENWRP